LIYKGIFAMSKNLADGGFTVFFIAEIWFSTGPGRHASDNPKLSSQMP
jgi:hypothetical protein